MATRGYPAIFDPYEDGSFVVLFPDFPGCVTQGCNLDDAVAMAEEALTLQLYGIERDGEDLPEPSDPSHVTVPEEVQGQWFVMLIHPRPELFHP
ncbi:type II toxin-antitoxin system HicB family antitoxin [Alicyclobacillus acidocaldarius]|uniref:HicB-like antitoxin of toxin-antitoxin system domain-containing protein n=1 Tax=Alicyclobacillus acidocaldarius subsp. acidocaldarius (strain ATCC 27009 / DSM 446 / BCRC 14685 / JCM 5260 / KCTC 1825 / NBRC 15652 / NCIMB 11725 / NRRL B-14509 / 104-IA) TaxID=521098 RepID=C8WPY0_ALIAD|nr:type II toxin-antitoxin system HicB family antitoxin [Alicyclobacillus acidocaldarius]ACV57084.1 protein of unknown function UPF0150 [Alicyclobacillus acidocaldarius subsp. acidocaldarius DSM 446]